MSRIKDYLIEKERIQQEIYQRLWEEHDCKAGPDHECSTCGLLIEVGFLSGWEPNWEDYEDDNPKREQEEIEFDLKGGD